MQQENIMSVQREMQQDIFHIVYHFGDHNTISIVPIMMSLLIHLL